MHFFPGSGVGGDSTKVRDRFIAHQVQQLACPGASGAALAIYKERLRLIREGLLCFLQNPAHGKVDASGDMATVIFAGIADIHQNRIGDIPALFQPGIHFFLLIHRNSSLFFFYDSTGISICQ